MITIEAETKNEISKENANTKSKFEILNFSGDWSAVRLKFEISKQQERSRIENEISERLAKFNLENEISEQDPKPDSKNEIFETEQKAETEIEISQRKPNPESEFEIFQRQQKADFEFEIFKRKLLFANHPWIRDFEFAIRFPGQRKIVIFSIENLISTSRKLLCQKAPVKARASWQALIETIAATEPAIASVCVPECLFRGTCPRLKSCGYYPSEKWLHDLIEYRTGDEYARARGCTDFSEPKTTLENC